MFVILRMPDSELVQWFLCLHGPLPPGRLDMENGTCFIFSVSVEVVTASDRRLYITAMETNGSNPKITCPDKVDNLCKKEKGDLSWDRVCHQSLYPLSNPDLPHP